MTTALAIWLGRLGIVAGREPLVVADPHLLSPQVVGHLSVAALPRHAMAAAAPILMVSLRLNMDFLS
jgi:hypothetical protein